MNGIKTITNERYWCEYCGDDGSWVETKYLDHTYTLTYTVNHEGKRTKAEIADHILKNHPEKILERLDELEQFRTKVQDRFPYYGL